MQTLTSSTGRKFAAMEFRIVIVQLVLNFEFLPLPEKLATMAAKEKVFREPQMAYAQLKIL